MQTKDTSITIGSRIGSIILDQILMSVICLVFFIPSLAKYGVQSLYDQKLSEIIKNSFLYVEVIGFALYFCKDCINGRSLGKRIIKHQVINNTTAEIASPIKCFIRNIFCVIWPIELIALLFNPSRRLGDYIAGTRVQSYIRPIKKPTLNIKQIFLSFILSYCFNLLIILLIR